MRRPAPLIRSLLGCLLLVGVYYVVPVGRYDSATQLAVRAGITLVGLAAVTWFLANQIRSQVVGAAAPLNRLLIALVTGVLFFALVDYTVAIGMPGQFSALATRTDALYFALSTLATVGFGDVHAVGQIARLLVISQILFNLGLVAGGGSVLVRQVAALVRRRQTGGTDPDPSPPDRPA